MEKKKEKKKVTKKKKKKGFTLIELLAVIIILGVIMMIAIPSVTNTITNSRKDSYVSTAKQVVKGAIPLVNGGEIEAYDTDTTYYIPASSIETENSLASPFAEFEQAYVIVGYTGEGYVYYWASVDKAHQGIEMKDYNKIVRNDVKPNIESIDTTIGIGNRKYIRIYDEEIHGFTDPELANSYINENGEMVNRPPLRTVYVVSDTPVYIGSTIPSNVIVRNTANEAMTDWENIHFSNPEPMYLKLLINNNNVIQESYLEYIITPEMVQEKPVLRSGTYSLKVGVNESNLGDKPIFNQNVSTLQRSVDQSNCNLEDGTYGCEYGDSYNNVWVSSDGFGLVNFEGVNCYFGDSDSGISCSIWK